MDVTKATFINKLENQFNKAKAEDCQSFDDVFFGICGSCNKGCEGMTFLSESGYYLDLYIESKDGEYVEDIYVCNKLTNFIALNKTRRLSFSFYKDETVTFKPSSEYTLIKQQYQQVISYLDNITGTIHLNKLLKWYDGFDYLRRTIDQLGPFECFDYVLYSNAFSLTIQMDKIVNIKSKADEVTEGLIDYHLAKSEREKLIWFYKNKTNQFGTSYFILPQDWQSDYTVIFTKGTIEIKIDITGFGHVMDYFEKLDSFYDALMEKYKPLPEHFEQPENGSIEYSLESHLRLHNKYLDIIQKFSSGE